MNVPTPSFNSASAALLELPVDGVFGAAFPALAVLAIGVVITALLRSKRTARPAPVPSSAAA